jgi:hypothetical protein
MNLVITDGIDLMPPPFLDGLSDWSSTDGTPGSPDYASASNAALVPSDPDFGACLEIQKVDSTQRLRYKGEVPLLPGCYLRVSARVKAMSGPLPNLRIAAWAGGAGGVHVTGQPEVSSQTVVESYGRIYEISAYVATAKRTGVNMQWSQAVVYGHFGLDILGANGSVVRIESVKVEDMTVTFQRKLMDWVDVRDYGAKADGTTDDADAFEAADAAANGREVLISEGTYFLGRAVTMTSRCRFEGRITMADQHHFALAANFEFARYVEAFGSETLGLKKAIQALFKYSGHDTLDLGGRRIELSAPIDVWTTVGGVDNFASRRMIRNGQIAANANTAFDTATVNATADHDPGNGNKLTDVTNISAIPVGALVSGNGVGREVYVTAKDTGNQTLTLSRPLAGPAATQSYSFKRFRYLLDFSGFASIQNFQIVDIEFACAGRASAVMLPVSGFNWSIRSCTFTRPKDRGITSPGTGCYSLVLEGNDFQSNEYDTPVVSRSTIAFNANSADLKVRNNRSVRFLHFGVLGGTGNIISGNHFWQGDESVSGERSAGLVLTKGNLKSVITGNYVDNSWIEISTEHDATPDFESGDPGLGGVSITANIFTANTVPNWFSWIRLAPWGSGHFIDGLAVIGNVFRVVADGYQVDRVEQLDTSNGNINKDLTRDLVFSGNTFEAVVTRSQSPVDLVHDQAGTASVWTVATGGRLPFGLKALAAGAAVAEGALTDAANAVSYAGAYVTPQAGAAGTDVTLHWPQPLKGRARVRVQASLSV